MDIVKKRIYISVLILIGAIIIAVLFILSRPQENSQTSLQPEINASSTIAVTYTSNESSYTVLGLTHTVPWDASCDDLGNGRKVDPIISIVYPQIQGFKNEMVQTKVNRLLEYTFLQESLEGVQATCGHNSNTDTNQSSTTSTHATQSSYESTGLDLSFEIKQQTDTFLSLKSAASKNLLSNLRPTVEYRGYTIDLTDGSFLTYRDIFKADIEARREMQKRLVAKLPKEVKANPDAGRDILDYDFYLTKDGVTFFNIFLSPVFQSIEISLLYKDIQDLMTISVSQ